MDRANHHQGELDLNNYQAVLFLESMGNTSPSQKQIDCIEKLLKNYFKQYTGVFSAYKKRNHRQWL